MKPFTPPITRRRALQQTFFFSAALAIGARRGFAQAPAQIEADDRHFLMIGDWGAGGGGRPAQRAVAAGMQSYAQSQGIRPDGLFLLGTTFTAPFPEESNVHAGTWSLRRCIRPASFPDRAGRCSAITITMMNRRQN